MKKKGLFVINKAVSVKVQDKVDDVAIEDALDFAGTGCYNITALMTCCIITVGGVIDLLGFSLILPAMSCDLQLDLKQSGILASVPFFEFIFAQAWGYFADTQGRYKALLFSVVPGFVFAFVSCFSTNFWMMAILKFLGSCFNVASITLVVIYLGEVTPRKYRNKFIFVQNFFNLASDFVCYSMAYFILTLDFALQTPLLTFRPWRLLTLLMTLPLGIGAVMLIFLHESPKFLANKGRTEKALDVLKVMYHRNGGQKENYSVKSLKEENVESEAVSLWDSLTKQVVPIFKPPLLWVTVQLFFLFAVVNATNNVFYVWFPTLMASYFNSDSVNENNGFCQTVNSNRSVILTEDQKSCNDTTPMVTIYSGLLFSLTFSVLSAIAILVTSWRKSLLIFSFAVSGISCVILNFVYQQVAVIISLILIQFCGICIGNVITYFIDAYPTSYRGLALCLGAMVARLLSIAGINLVSLLIVGQCSWIFYIVAIFMLCSIILSLFLPSDRKEQIGRAHV